MDNLQKIQNSQQNQEMELTIYDYWLIISRGKFWIIGSVIIVLAATFYFNYSVAPKYQSSVTLLIEKRSDSGAIFSLAGGIDQSEVDNQIELLKSRTVAIATVKKLWDPKYRNNLTIFGTKKFRPRGQRYRKFVKNVFTLGMFNSKEEELNYFTNDYSEKIGQIFSGNIQASIVVGNKRGTDMLTLSVINPFPEEAALIANTVAEEFVKLDRRHPCRSKGCVNNHCHS